MTKATEKAKSPKKKRHYVRGNKKVSSSKEVVKPKRPYTKKEPNKLDSSNRKVLAQFDKNGKIKGIFIDSAHANEITGIKTELIEKDINNNTEETGSTWLSVPVGNTINHRDIQKIARKMYSDLKGIKSGRKPVVDRNEVEKLIKNFDLSKIEQRDVRRVQKLFSHLTAKTSKKGKK